MSAQETIARPDSMAKLVAALGSKRLSAELFDWLSHILPFDLASIFIYRGAAAPLDLGNNFKDSKAKLGLARYLQGTYVINPFYQAYQTGLEPGVYRMRDLTPDAYLDPDLVGDLSVTAREDEEIGYLTDHWPAGQEELEIAIALPEGTMAEIALSRPAELGGYSETHLTSLQEVYPLLVALMQQHWHIQQLQEAPPAPDNRIDLLFDAFGRDRLSDRECEITQLILKGHSSESIGHLLGISVTTVKTHRKNAYSKLNISSQSELLSLFLDSLK